VTEAVLTISASDFIVYLQWFLGLFPFVIASLTINSSRQFYLDRLREETQSDLPHLRHLESARKRWPVATIIVPARNEELTLYKTLRSVLEIDWPKLEVIVVNDGSNDTTAQVIHSIKDSRLIVITHQVAQGKAASVNEAIDRACSDLILICDADSIPQNNSLNRMAAHFARHDDVAAVTGNPRLSKLPTFMSKLQAIEFSSTISTLRRGQAAWGRINTVSGIMMCIRADYVKRVGYFDPTQPTEDIELTWRLHRNGYRAIYEPAAQTGMEVPVSFNSWMRQRRRWGAGLAKTLQTHAWPIIKKREWPSFPLLIEGTISVIWCHVLIAMTGLWLLAWALGLPSVGNSLLMGRLGTMNVGIAIVQIFWGMHLDGHRDANIKRLWPLAPLYPLIYWWMSAFVVVISTIPSFFKRRSPIAWTKTSWGYYR
jgi:biofilm PGA synthesis N-glycosyltransferase PgaC